MIRNRFCHLICAYLFSPFLLCFVLVSSVTAQYGQSAPKVEVAEVISGVIAAQNMIEGRIIASQDLAIVTTIDGVVKLASWRDGDFVDKGVLIAQQDTAKTQLKHDQLALQQSETNQLITQIKTSLDFEADLLALAQAQTALQQARLERLTELATENIVPKDRLDEALRAYLQARQAEVTFQKNIAKLESDLIQTQIKVELIAIEIADAKSDIISSRLIAPAAGQLVSVTSLDNQYFRKGEMVAQIRASSGYEIEVDIPISMLGFLRQGKTITGFDAAGRELTAIIRSEIPTENQKTNSRSVRFTITSELTPAMMADQARVRVNIPASDQQAVVTIPSDAIIPDADGVYVFVIKDDKVFRRNIAIGATIADRIVIKTDLTIGEKIVTKGNEGLRDGMAVEIVQP